MGTLFARDITQKEGKEVVKEGKAVWRGFRGRKKELVVFDPLVYGCL